MGSIRSAASRWTLVGGVVMTAAGMSVAAPLAASASTSKCTTANGLSITAKTAGSASAAKSICAGLSYYKGKTVTFVAADNPGGGFDQNARIYAPYLQKYIGATFNVVNIPAGNTVAGMNDVAASNTSNPGLTVGWMNVGPIVEDKVLGISGVNFNAGGEAMLGATAANLTATVAYKSAACAAWDNGFAGLLANNSVTHRVSEPIQTTGSTTFNQLIIDGVFGIHYRAIPGYGSSTQLLSGWVRGDGCVITEPVSTVGTFLSGGTAVPLLINVPLQTTNEYYKDFIGVPTYAEAEKQYSKYIKNNTQKAAVPVLNLAGETQRVFYVPPKTPQNEQAALRAAFKWASYNSSLKGQLQVLGAPTGYVSGTTAKTEYLQYYTDTKRVTEYLTALG